MRILYVEDNQTNLSLVQRLARVGNHEVINHTDGETALASFESDHPDLVLMDIQLKGVLNGLDVVKALRERGVKTPIIAVTAYAMLGDRERCLDAGCDAYLAKPLPIEQLVELFERYDPTPQATAPSEPVTADVVQPAVQPKTVLNGAAEIVKLPASSETPLQPASTPETKTEVPPETASSDPHAVPASTPETTIESKNESADMTGPAASDVPAQSAVSSEPAPKPESEAAPEAASLPNKPSAEGNAPGNNTKNS